MSNPLGRLPTCPCKGEVDREASGSRFFVARKEGVDGRDKPSHDGCGVVR